VTSDADHSLSLVTWHPMLIIVCERKIMTNIGCQVTSDRLWPTLSVKWRVTDWSTSGVKSRVTDYYQHRVSSHEWLNTTTIWCQVTSDRSVTCDLTPNVGHNLSLVTWPPDVGNKLSLVTWHSMLDSLSLVTWHNVGHSLLLVTWHQMLVILVTSDRLWPTYGVKWRVTDYDQHRAASHE
jgi:hypothetical protein